MAVILRTFSVETLGYAAQRKSMPRILWLVTIILFLISAVYAHAADNTTEVGSVGEVEGEAQIVSSTGAMTVVVGAIVRVNDELRTGTDGLLQVTFRDNTVLTLGESASVVIDRYVFNPDQGIGEVLLQTTQGDLRFATGRLKELQEKTITVTTPVAETGVRGTEFWAGPIDAQYSVLLLEGAISVNNQAGSVTLSTPGQGTEIHSRFEAPRSPTVWSRDRVERALKRTLRRHDLKRGDRSPSPGHELKHRRGRRIDKDAKPHAVEPHRWQPPTSPGGSRNPHRRHLLPSPGRRQ